MSADFVPLFPPQPARPETEVFSTLAPKPAPPLSSAHASGIPPSEVKVELKREGGRISQIRLHCRCGEVIEVDCEY